VIREIQALKQHSQRDRRERETEREPERERGGGGGGQQLHLEERRVGREDTGERRDRCLLIATVQVLAHLMLQLVGKGAVEVRDGAPRVEDDLRG